MGCASGMPEMEALPWKSEEKVRPNWLAGVAEKSLMDLGPDTSS